jgi:hypothetical protein
MHVTVTPKAVLHHVQTGQTRFDRGINWVLITNRILAWVVNTPTREYLGGAIVLIDHYGTPDGFPGKWLAQVPPMDDIIASVIRSENTSAPALGFRCHSVRPWHTVPVKGKDDTARAIVLHHLLGKRHCALVRVRRYGVARLYLIQCWTLYRCIACHSFRELHFSFQNHVWSWGPTWPPLCTQRLMHTDGLMT